jgi:hypothetical protein
MFNLLQVLFGSCSHMRSTFPMTTRSKRRAEAANMTGTYVVCLDCGTEFPYDWHRMKMMDPPQDERGQIAKAPGEVLKPVA